MNNFNSTEAFLLQIVLGTLLGISLVSILGNSCLSVPYLRRIPKMVLLCLDILTVLIICWLLLKIF